MDWYRIPNHENYEINRDGEVRFCGATIHYKDGRQRHFHPRLCRLLKTKRGYYVSCDGVAVSVSYIMVTLFVPNPKGYKQFHHIDGNIYNHNITNLRWGLAETLPMSNTETVFDEKSYLAKYYEVTRNGDIVRKFDGVKLLPSLDAKGYLRIRLKAPALSSNLDKRKPYKVHRLVAMFHLSNYSDKLQVNHINGNKQDNRVENLEMVTASENALHSWNVLESANRRAKLRERRNNDTGHFQ